MIGTDGISDPLAPRDPTPEDAGEPPGPPADGLELDVEPLPTHEQVAQLRDERDTYLDQLQRERAEFANFRRRVERDRVTLRAGVIKDVIGQILPVLDNLERAVTALTAQDPSLVGGVDMVRVQMAQVLVANGVVEVPALGHPFDPNLHDAIASVPSSDAPEGMVIEVVEKGYRTDAELVRAAKVVVSTGNA